MENDKRIAMLIDADNVSDKYIKYIFDEITNHGTPTYKRIYADWTKPQSNSWKKVLLDYSISPVQQYGYTVGKNSTDSALIIDAMDILYSKNIEGFCIVSSDSDFTRLAARLRESGMFVIGMGEKKTPKSFIAACEKFKYLEVLASTPDETISVTADEKEDNKEDSKEEKPANGAAAPAIKQPILRDDMISKLELTKTIASIISENSDEEGWTNLSEIGDKLNKRHPDFDTRNYGQSKLSTFILSLKKFEIMKKKSENPNRNDIMVKIKTQV
jgi:uncharacterized LabA/DUF88 family protein/Fe-S-cluster formation regulator IscX/YfhJ